MQDMLFIVYITLVYSANCDASTTVKCGADTALSPVTLDNNVSGNNVALMKATVQSTSHRVLTSSRSNDGRLDTGWRSAEQDHPWWAVIVGVNGLEYDLERVIVYQDLSVDCGNSRNYT